MTIGTRLKMLRKENDVKQIELSVLSGIKSGNLSMIENDYQEVKLSTLRKLANAFGITLSELLEGVD